MDWFNGQLTITDKFGKAHSFSDVPFSIAQNILNQRFPEGVREAMFYPSPCSMAPSHQLPSQKL